MLMTKKKKKKKNPQKTNHKKQFLECDQSHITQNSISSHILIMTMWKPMLKTVSFIIKENHIPDITFKSICRIGKLNITIC